MKQSLNIVIAVSLFISSQLALAQAAAVPVDDTVALSYSVAGLMEEYPADSIQSSERADAAVKAATEARAGIEARYAAEQRACYPKFFTNACLNKATERRRLDLLLVRPIELEANSYIRHARVEVRDERLEEQARARAEKEGMAPPVTEPKMNTDKPVDAAAEQGKNTQRKARADAYAKKNAEHAEKQKQLKESEQTEATRRAENVSKYEAKVKEAAARQKDVAEKKAAKEQERARKAANTGNSN